MWRPVSQNAFDVLPYFQVYMYVCCDTERFLLEGQLIQIQINFPDCILQGSAFLDNECNKFRAGIPWMR